MKKLMTITIMTLIPMVGFAKVSDFNAMINDNMNAQSQLHNSVQDNMGTMRTAVREKSNAGHKVVMREDAGDTYNATTTRGALTFQKEKNVNLRKKAQFDRLATEINDSSF